MIKAVIFDLGRVIVPFDFQRGYTRMASLCPYTAAEIPVRLRGTDLVTRFETGLLEPADFVRQLSSILDLRCTFDQFSDIWSSIFLPETLVPENLLVALKQRYRLLLLSNTNALHFKMIDSHYPLLRHFDEKVLSYEIGAMKPSPRIYEEAIQRAGCQAGECFFTDDIEAYVAGARQAGMAAVQFTSYGQLQRDMRLHGIEW